MFDIQFRLHKMFPNVIKVRFRRVIKLKNKDDKPQWYNMEVIQYGVNSKEVGHKNLINILNVFKVNHKDAKTTPNTSFKSLYC